VSTAIATTDVDRLGKLLRLALVADKDGEAIAAIGAVKRLLDSNGLDPHWVVDTFERGATLVAVTPDDESSERDDRSAAWYAFHRRHALSPRERLFIENIVERAAPLTPRQAKWLHDIVDGLEAG
jgi:DNA-binding transcriptional LysR family regulator